MMAGDGVTTTSAAGVGPTYDVGERTIGLNEIKVSRGNVIQLMTEIADQRYTLQEHLGQSNRRTDVEIDPAAVHPANKFSQ